MNKNANFQYERFKLLWHSLYYKHNFLESNEYPDKEKFTFILFTTAFWSVFLRGTFPYFFYE